MTPEQLVTAEEACRDVRAMGPYKLAVEIEKRSGEKCSGSAVSQWKTVPPKRVLLVEEITGISRHRLRPDFYPLQKDDGNRPLEPSKEAVDG